MNYSKLPQQMDIPGFNGAYFVRIDGTVWSRKRNKEKQLTGSFNKYNRNRQYYLSAPDGKFKMLRISQIMRMTYFPNLPADWRLTHKDGLGDNFAVWNLKPMHRLDASQKGGKAGGRVPVVKVDSRTGEEVAFYGSIEDAAKANGVNSSVIWRIVNGKNKRYGEYGPGNYIYRKEETRDAD